jgi:alpha-galactosidase
MMDLVLAPHLAGSTIVLVDLNEDKLDLMARLARRMVAQHRECTHSAQGAQLTIEATTDRRQALPGADYVITTISVGGQKAWELDLTIPTRYGVIQSVGDSVGPGGVSRALRHIPVILGVARDMEQLCPQAILFNYTNPMTAICRAVSRETRIQVVGLCHGVPNTVRYLAEYMEVPPESLEVRAAGINHLVWMTQLLRDGQDAYPALRDLMARKGPGDRPASFELMRIYGLFPGPGHDHIVEFYPHFTSERAEFGKRYGLGLFPLDTNNAGRERRTAQFQAQAAGREPIQIRPSGEDVMEIITAMITHQAKLCAVNVPNRGAIPELPPEAVVEVSSLVDGAGIQPLRIAGLPKGILATLRARLDQQELTVDAAVRGDRNAALQAILAEPLVHSVADAQGMLDELLRAHAAYLPTFS